LAHELPERQSAQRRSGLGERLRAFDWAATEVGAIDRWPASLHTVLDLMLATNQAMFMILGAERRLLYNDPATALLGRRHPTALGQPLRSAWPEVADDLAPALAEACAGSPAWIDRVRLRAHAAGRPRERLFSLALSPLRDDAGRLHGALCTCNEIVRRQAGWDDPSRLQTLAPQGFRTLADQMPQLAWMADPAGRIFWHNARWFEYTGQSAHADPADAWRAAQHPEHVDRVLAKRSRCFGNQEPWEDLLPLRGRDDGYRWFLSRAQPVLDRAGDLAGWIGTHTDVTEHRAHAERLREAERQTSEFLAVLGHELRNPLAAVRSAAELVSLSQPKDHRLHRAWVVLERQCAHMARLIDSLLEVSRISRGKVRLDRKILDVRTVLDDMLQDRSTQIVESGLTFQRQLSDEPLWVLADEVRLAQVFDNLIGNAMKFTEAPGCITVAAGRRRDDVEIRVQDTGAGIRPENLTRIFEPFHQDTEELSRAAGGLGLGLALAKGLTELHDGTVEARSEGPGTGAEFVVRLPAAAAPAAEPGPERQPAPERRHILIVEDNVDVAEMLQFVLKMQSHRVHVAADGAAALKVLRREPIDIVLCDLGLPVMSGYELARQIRSDAALRRIALVALTGYGRSSDRQRTEEAGFDAHLTKPVELHDLEALLCRLPARPPL
jgi:PAS domain S-box-containing protein